MALYSLAVRTTGTAIGAAAEFRAPSGSRIRVREITITLAAATASSYALGRPAAIGVTPTGPVTVLAQDPADPVGLTTGALLWATAPTSPVQFFRRITLPATIGSGITWLFGPNELVIGQVAGVAAAVTSLVLWNLAANGAVDAVIVVDE